MAGSRKPPPKIEDLELVPDLANPMRARGRARGKNVLRLCCRSFRASGDHLTGTAVGAKILAMPLLRSSHNVLAR